MTAYAYDPDDLGGNISEYCWDLDWLGYIDGEDYIWDESYSSRCDDAASWSQYLDEGWYRVSVRVKDDDGDWSQWSDWTDDWHFNVSKAPYASVSSLTCVEVYEGENVTFTSNSWDDRDDYGRCWYTCSYIGHDGNTSLSEVRWYETSNYTDHLSNSSSFETNFTPGWHYVRVWVKDADGIWSRYCSSCEVTLKVWDDDYSVPLVNTTGGIQYSVNSWVPWDDYGCLLYTSPSPRDATLSRMPSSA